jgi:hypothetical protein
LVAGSGVVAGTGITSSDLGLEGHLARILAAATGHGIPVQVAPIAVVLARSARVRILLYEVGAISDPPRFYDTKSYERSANELVPCLTGFLRAMGSKHGISTNR